MTYMHSLLFVAIAFSFTACSTTPPEMPEPNCRIPVPPEIGLTLRGGSGGLDTDLSALLDLSGNNGFLNVEMECVPMKSEKTVKIRVGL